MWSRHQNLDKPRVDATGKRWNFRVWHDGGAQRIFFWDDPKKVCGVVLLLKGRSVHVRYLRSMIQKLVADPALREQHRRELRFPLERHYAEYGAFPEERASDL